MDAVLRKLVWDRAAGCCEYRHMTADFDPLPFCVDHVVAQQHHGPTEESNLALSCYNCNSYKDPNIAGVDPDTGGLARLFHPCTDVWAEHFEWSGAILIGKSPVARATIDVLNINDPDRVEHRRLLIEEGVFPG